MPIDKERYPTNWNEISADIRFNRAANRCEGCKAPNGEIVYRRGHPGEWITYCSWVMLHYGQKAEWWPVRVVLTVHHRGVPRPDGTPGDRHDKMDCRPENLAALCQSCHWKADWDIPYEKAVIVRRQKKIEAGQPLRFA